MCCCRIDSCRDELNKVVKNDDKSSVVEVLRRIENLIDRAHKQHHTECSALCKEERFLENARVRLIKKIESLNEHKRQVVSILVTGTTGSRVIDDDFVVRLKTLGVHVVQKCRHPSSALYNAEKSVKPDGTILHSSSFFLF